MHIYIIIYILYIFICRAWFVFWCPTTPSSWATFMLSQGKLWTCPALVHHMLLHSPTLKLRSSVFTHDLSWFTCTHISFVYRRQHALLSSSVSQDSNFTEVWGDQRKLCNDLNRKVTKQETLWMRGLSPMRSQHFLGISGLLHPFPSSVRICLDKLWTFWTFAEAGSKLSTFQRSKQVLASW